MVQALAEEHGVSFDTPYEKLPKKFTKELLYGTGSRHLKYDYRRSNGQMAHRDHPFEGLINNLERRYRKTNSEMMKEWLQKYMTVSPCEACGGKRLKPEVLAVTVGGLNIAEFCDMPVKMEMEFIEKLTLSEKDEKIAHQILKEITARLQFMKQVGLDYLTMSRASATLSGGESQRIRLATQIGSGLVGVLYILDEPSIGLHQKDNAMSPYNAVYSIAVPEIRIQGKGYLNIFVKLGLILSPGILCSDAGSSIRSSSFFRVTLKIERHIVFNFKSTV